HGDSFQRDSARRPRTSIKPRIPRPASAPVRVPVVVRDGGDARLFALDDSLWGRPFHSGEKSCHGPLTTDSDTVPGRFPVIGAVPRFRGGSSAFPVGPRKGWP